MVRNMGSHIDYNSFSIIFYFIHKQFGPLNYKIQTFAIRAIPGACVAAYMTTPRVWRSLTSKRWSHPTRSRCLSKRLSSKFCINENKKLPATIAKRFLTGSGNGCLRPAAKRRVFASILIRTISCQDFESFKLLQSFETFESCCDLTIPRFWRNSQFVIAFLD